MKNKHIEDIIQGVNIDLNPRAKTAAEEGVINYPSGNRLEFRTEDNTKGNYFFDYFFEDKKIRFNDLLNDDRWRFIPVYSGFTTRFTNKGRPLQHPEISINIYKRIENEVTILAILHEIGHAKFLNCLYNIAMGSEEKKKNFEKIVSNSPLYPFKFNKGKKPLILPKLKGTYNEELIVLHNFFNFLFDQDKIISERNAWSYALREKKRLGLLKHLNNFKIKEFYINSLLSYGCEKTRRKLVK